jgi:hypothetical protein
MAPQMRLVTLFLIGTLLSLSTQVHAYGLIGYGVSQNQPFCAYSCAGVVSGYTLTCSTASSSSSGKAKGHGSSTTANCTASNAPYLQTLAYCLDTNCPSLAGWQLEQFWEADAVSTSGGQMAVAPMWSYSQSLASLKGPPNGTLKGSATLKNAVVVPQTSYQAEYNTIAVKANNNILNSTFA